MKYMYLYFFINLLITIKPIFHLVISTEEDKDYLGFIGAFVMIVLFGIFVVLGDIAFTWFYDIKSFLKKFKTGK